MVGLRHKIGGDWNTYTYNMERIGRMDFLPALAFDDPGYYGINWLIFNMGGEIYWVNFICAAILVYGVIKFAQGQPLPWLAILVSVPYLLIVVGMGYTRQSAALGFALLALIKLAENDKRSFAILIVMGALFHKSAVLLLPIAALSASTNRLWSYIWVGCIAAVAAYSFLYQDATKLWQNYVEADYHSEGGLIRAAMNAVPATVFLMIRRYFNLGQEELKLWTWLSLFSLISVPLVFISSTAVDRVALYFLPLQLYVFSRLPVAYQLQGNTTPLTLLTAAYYGLVLFVWLNYASNAKSWLPYENYFFML